VAFVDEAIHHATPFYEHRYITPTELKRHLERKHKNKFGEMVRADNAHRNPGMLSSFSSALWGPSSLASNVNKSVVPANEIAVWEKLLSMTQGESDESMKDRTKRFTRDDFAFLPAGFNFDHMLLEIGSQPAPKEGTPEGRETGTREGHRQKGGAGGWHSGSIPKSPSPLAPITPGNEPLKRRASTADFREKMPEQLGQDVPRKFIRSWVRAVPAALADRVRE